MIKHIFFDLDSTLTPSRAQMLPEHVPIFERVCGERDVIVVTGGAVDQIRAQIPLPNSGNYYMLSQQGNHAVGKDGTLLWHETVSARQEQAVRAFADVLTSDLGLPVKDKTDLFENRGSQLAYSTLGFHESNEKKYAYDPDQAKRRGLLARHADELKKLRDIGIEAMPAGTTTIDFILAGKNKGRNIARLMEDRGWKKEECLYIGDALFPGGNDESVIGVIPTHAVKDPSETFDFIQRELLSS
ncbi:MAG: HAD-IIB family hydrolase [Patescibacteria group bacterium]|nr:HAD-IIB family hydrolase [Patescibacteria group bacterium]